MKITYFDDYEQLSTTASGMIEEKISGQPDLLLCAATGNSPFGTYQKLVEKYDANPGKFNDIRIIKLDEWGGVPMENSQTCESFLLTNLVKPLKVKDTNYISFKSNPSDKEEECKRIDSYLKSNGPIDLCVLGLGLNGHIAFNEPDEFLIPECHITNLSNESQQHPMYKSMGIVPEYGLTIGMKDILLSRTILLIVSGKGKGQIIKELLSGRISTRLPASFLWLHPDTECLVDSEIL